MLGAFTLLASPSNLNRLFDRYSRPTRKPPTRRIGLGVQQGDAFTQPYLWFAIVNTTLMMEPKGFSREWGLAPSETRFPGCDEPQHHTESNFR